ncbi:MAG: ABC transporter ATP-binding protein [Tissierellales bacterium]|jgi:putative ABC transport system ATP-binding protein|nr:ABC transporter ATP-binding protein [Tissierellales bacterium]
MIQIKDLWKVYDTGSVEVRALQGIDLHIKKGEFVSIIGASGSGKSTLMNILGCLDKPSDGLYSLDGEQIEKLKAEDLAYIRNQKIGFVFQSFNLIPRVSALHNVELPMIYGKIGKKERREKARNALIRVGLEERMEHNPNELSGGQKQRVAIARSLVNNPAIILADEPTGNLDSKSTDEIMDIFQKLNDEGATVVIVTHENEIAEKTKRIITFKDGQIISDVMNEVRGSQN